MNFVASLMVALLFAMGTVLFADSMSQQWAQASCDPPPADPPKKSSKK